MYRVMIVDDDKLIIDDLMTLINWEELDCLTPKRAVNGKAALQLLSEELYDIVLTDISMPIMDGVELIRCAKEKRYPAVFIVISNYDDFTYVKEAMKLGAAEYLLKYEITAESLSKQIRYAQKCTKMLKQEQTEAQTEAMQQRLLREIYNGNSGVYSWTEMAQMAGVSQVKGMIVPVLLLIFQGQGQQTISKTSELLQMLIADHKDVVLMKEVEMNQILLLFFIDTPSYMYVTHAVSVFLKLLFSQAKQNEISLGAYLMSYCHNLSEVCRVVGTARKQRTGLFYLQPFSIFADIEEKPGKADKPDEAEWGKVISAGEPKMSCAALFQSFEKGYVSPDEVKGFCVRLLARFAVQQECDDQTVADIWNARSAYEIQKMMEVFVEKQRSIEFKSVSRAEVRQALRYISDNYAKEITLEDVSDVVGLSAAYLSRLFRSEMGISYSEYLNKVRIDQAKVLIKKSNLRTNEISGRVGFQDYRYFCRVFKKMTGVTCSEYRRKRIAEL